MWQPTNFVVFPEFFEGKKALRGDDKSGDGSRSEKYGSRRGVEVWYSPIFAKWHMVIGI